MKKLACYNGKNGARNWDCSELEGFESLVTVGFGLLWWVLIEPAKKL